MSFAPHLNYPGGWGQSNNDSPITPAGAMKINAKVDKDARDENKTKIQLGQCAIGGGAHDENWSINHYDLCVQLRESVSIFDEEDESHSSNGPTEKLDIQTYILPCANGFGLPGETQAQMTERIARVFVSTGRNAVPGQSDIVAMLTGGMTTVINTGPRFIGQGQKVMVVIPDPRNPRVIGDQNGIPPTRIPFWTVPVDEEHTIGNMVSAYKLLTGGYSEKQTQEYSQNYPFSFKFAQALQEHVRRSFIACLMTGIKAGIVAPVPKDDWQKTQNNLEADQKKKENADNWAQALATQLPTYKLHGLGDDKNKDMPLIKYVTKSLLAQEGDYFFYQPDTTNMSGQKIFTEKYQKDIVDAQRNNFSGFAAAVRHADAQAQRLVIGEALSNAKTGQSFDLQIQGSPQ